MKIPKNKEVEYYRSLYPFGTRIQLDADMDDPHPVPVGTKGTIIAIDDMAQAIMKWDNGQNLSLILNHYNFHVISQKNDNTEIIHKQKPMCPIIGANGNIFNILGIASRTLKDNGMADEAKEMYNRVTSSSDYQTALCIIAEYIEPCTEQDIRTESERNENRFQQL